MLLEKGANVDSRDSEGRTPHSLAAGRGHDGVVRMLRNKTTGSG